MIVQKNQVLHRENRRPIVYDVFKPQQSEDMRVVIFCHGYKGFKDWGAWDHMASNFAEAGFTLIKFNFSHNGGTVEQPIDFPDPEAFGQNNFSKELEDLKDIVERLVLPLEPVEISLIGHSRGGGISSIYAEEDMRIAQVITWAGVSDFRIRFMEGTEAFDKWRNLGVTHIENSRTGQQLPHYFQFYEDFIANEERLTIKRAVSQLTIPHLIIHGDEDPTVLVEEANALHRWNPNSQRYIIEGADHVFNIKHPWDDTYVSKAFRLVIDRSIDFIKSTATS